MWRALRPHLTVPGWDAMRVENIVMTGVPDVHWIGNGGVSGWLELKSVSRWPARGGVLHLPHFTPQQRIWLLKRRMLNGRADLLLKVGEQWLLFEGRRAGETIGKEGRHGLEAAAVLVLPRLDGAAVRKALTR